MKILKIIDYPLTKQIRETYKPKLAAAKAVLADVSEEMGEDFTRLNERERRLIVAALDYCLSNSRDQGYDFLRSISDMPLFKTMIAMKA